VSIEAPSVRALRPELPVFVLLAGLGCAPQWPAPEAGLPRVAISTRADLVVALKGPPDVLENIVRLGLLAAQGPRVAPLLRAVAADERAGVEARGNAIVALSLLFDSSLLPLMVDLARRPGPLQGPALNALSFSPHDTACGFWRSVLQGPPSGLVFGIALGGIRYCAEADTALVQAILRRETSFGTRETGGRSMALLHLPIADRYRLTPLEGNYPPTGSYRPPPRFAAEIRKAACGGTCPPDLVLKPSRVAELRSPWDRGELR
jgi:hypothetical protein